MAWWGPFAVVAVSTAGMHIEHYAALRDDAGAGLSNGEIQRGLRWGWRTVKAVLSSAGQSNVRPTRRGKETHPPRPCPTGCGMGGAGVGEADARWSG